MKPQDTTATIASVPVCQPELVSVPLDVTGFTDVAAITIDIVYDTSRLEFVDLENIHPAIQGGFAYNSSGNRILASWVSLAPVNLASATLFDMHFDYSGDSAEMHFSEMEVINSQFEELEVDTIPGGVFHPISITKHPDSLRAYPESDVLFLVLSSGNDLYQWQENTGDDWLDLENVYPYSGATTNILNIASVPLSYNGNLYRCELSTDDGCIKNSDPALLQVAEAYPEATIGTGQSCPEAPLALPFDVFDFTDVKSFEFNIAFDTSVLEFETLTNFHPALQNGNLETGALADTSGISITWFSNNTVYFGATKLFDLNFNFGSDTSVLDLTDGTEVLNSFGNQVVVTWNNGEALQYEVPEIVHQPASDTVAAGYAAEFMVSALNTALYQWQLSDDGGEEWTDLEEAYPYASVNTDKLFIISTVTGMSGNLYRCLLEGDYCQETTMPAMLTVDTTTGTKETLIKDIFRAYPNPAREAYYIQPPDLSARVLDIAITDLSGRVIRSGNETIAGGSPLKIDVSGLGCGIYLVRVSVADGGPGTQTFKMIKISPQGE